MYKQKLTLDPKLAEICEATLTVCDAEPLQQETLEKAANFKVLGCSKLSEQEMNAHKLMRVAAPLATGQKDVAVTELKCVSVEGNVLPAEFQMHYVFHVANYSNEAIASVPVTIYFNTPDHALVEQGTTTVKNIPAGHYQALEFTFPGVVAGQWKMSMEANKPRAFEESNYANNLLSRTFTYVNKAELIAESVSAVDDDPKFDADGHQILYYDVPTALEFVLSNVSAIDAKNVLVQVPAAFEDMTGAHPAKLAETRMDVPAHTRRTLKLDITFNKPATAQIGLLLNNDRACDEVNYENNETHEIFSITKYNPGTGPDPEPEEAVDIDFSDPSIVALIPGRMTMPLYDQSEDATWKGIDETKDRVTIDALVKSGCGICALAMVLTYMNDSDDGASNVTPADVYHRGVSDPNSVSIDHWDKASQNYTFDRTSLTSELTSNVRSTLKNEIVIQKQPVILHYFGSPTHFVVVSGYEFDPKKVGTSGYASDPYDLSHFKVMDPYKGEAHTLQEVVNSPRFSSWDTMRTIR